jgi:hypothetical protein
MQTFVLENFKIRDHLEDLYIDRKIIGLLKLVLKKWGSLQQLRR